MTRTTPHHGIGGDTDRAATAALSSGQRAIAGDTGDTSTALIRVC
jgi:hypothetical protein